MEGFAVWRGLLRATPASILFSTRRGSATWKSLTRSNE